MLQIKELTKIYPNGKRAVDGLNMVIEDGDIYGFIGKNGAGKTTTLKACFGIIGIDKGQILLDGISVIENPIKCKKKMAFVPDSPQLEEYMTGIQYLNFVCDIYGVSVQKRIKKIKYYTKVFDMGKNLNNLISAYSHGMKQKIALIAAFVHEPRILVLDEPFIGLDPEAFITLKAEMKKLCEKGNSVLFSSHILDAVEKNCNKISILKEGKLVSSGLINEIVGNQNLEDIFVKVNEK